RVQLGGLAALEPADQRALAVDDDLAGAAQRLARLAVLRRGPQLDAGGEPKVPGLAADRALVAPPRGADRLAALHDDEGPRLVDGVQLVGRLARPADEAARDLALGTCPGGLAVLARDLEAAAEQQRREEAPC